MLLHVPTFCMQEAVGAFGMRLTTHSQSPRLSYNIKDISSCASLSLKGYEDPNSSDTGPYDHVDKFSPLVSVEGPSNQYHLGLAN